MKFQNFDNKAQVETLLGKRFYAAVQKMLANEKAQCLGRKFKRLPWTIEVHTTKPKFALHDFETMDAFMVNLETMEVSGHHYCGSGVSTWEHQGEQLSEGYVVPEGYALVFLTSIHGGSGNTPWTLDIVSQNITRQIEASQPSVIGGSKRDDVSAALDKAFGSK